MAKSACEDKLEKTEDERKYWRERAQKAEQAAAELRDILKSLLANAQAHSGGNAEEISILQEQRDRERRRADALEADLNSLVQKYGQLEFILEPARFTNLETLRNLPREQAERLGATTFISESPAIEVGYVIAAHSPDDDTRHVAHNGGMYWGSIESLRQEMKRIDSLIWRAPMPEDMRGSRMDAYGISQALQLQAIQSLCPYVYDPLLKQQFGEALDAVFTQMLKPHCPPDQADRAREAFRKSVQATYGKLAENRGIDLEIPKLAAGARGKSESEQNNPILLDADAS